MLSSNFQAFPTVDSTYFEQGTSTNGGRVSPKPTLSTHGMSTAVKATVRSVAFPLLVDVKSEFIKALPDSMSLRAKRDLMYYLNKASDVVLNKDTLMFVCEE